jgi:drug/metabolite transporter (DMT)-like permease
MMFWQWIGGAVILAACLVEVFAGDKDNDNDTA